MLKKSITYENFDEEEATEDFFFHLSKAELIKLEMSYKGGLEASIQRIIAAEDGKAIIEEFENIILLSYGKRSDDGKRFVKNDQIREEFKSSEAYSALFMELVTNSTAAAEFVAGVIPKNLADEAAKIAGADLKVVEPQEEKPEPRVITKTEVLEMGQDEFKDLGNKLARGEVVLEE